ncbi:heavy metal-binding domain-containing protein [Streptacidiphilus fuscans]|uniref:Heavy metal-binding domain-containing protein n=1 Tax=Streptacidiphilus fuscans TaxID=2789292 RepID=A0A931B905_9ACTN|nr:heavy metal-binding domain-containing protein [Streptacidiphilus fuscans]MBF9073334.1 heavy metal-binding domain-containing protein [Streptacidiphilus fuscans]
MTVPWNGGGLPPAAAERMAEVRGSGTWTSALSTGEFASVKSVGFEPVGQVMGSAVFQIARSGRYWGYHDCLYSGAGFGFSYGNRGDAPVALSGQGAPSRQLVGVFDQARRTALGRMTAECSALGGDGVVAAELTMAPFPNAPNCLEFKVIGTAVRAQGNVRPRHPFTCHLDGQGFAKLVSAGWVPAELLVGMSIGVRHDDYRTQSQQYSWQNTEMTGWSRLIHAIRADARQQLQLQASRMGGDGVIMAAGDLRVWRESCIRAANRNNSEQEDHVAEATMIGTSIARFRTGDQKPRTLSVMPLGKRGDRLRQRLAAVASSPYGDPNEYRRLADELSELGDQG